MALLHPERVTDEAARRAIAALVEGWPSGRDYFVTRLAEGVGTIAAAFWPRDGHRPALRLQDQRVRGTPRRPGLRAAGGEPDDRVPRRLALRPPGLSRGLRAGMRGDAPGARDDGPQEPQDHDPVLPPPRRGRPGAGGDGRGGARARRGRARDLRDVRDPVQRDPDRRVRRALRRLLDRLQRPHPAHAGRRPRQPDGGLRLRRARPGGDGLPAAGGRGRQAQRPALRHLRPGAVRLSRDRRVPGRAAASTRSA